MDYQVKKHSTLDISILTHYCITHNMGYQLLMYLTDGETTLHNEYYFCSLHFMWYQCHWPITPQNEHHPVLIDWVFKCWINWRYTHNIYTYDHISLSENAYISDKLYHLMELYCFTNWIHKNNKINKVTLPGW